MMDKMKDVPKVSKKDSGKKAKKEVPPAPKGVRRGLKSQSVTFHSFWMCFFFPSRIKLC